ncbi:MAG: ABC transporter permease [Clostridiales bacterium]|nr:ABC transporter permease [Clostridiales bacterium]
MKAFFSSIDREFRLIFRNGISIFMVAAPAILAFVFILVFGAVSGTVLRLAVDQSITPADQQKLERVADVERFDDASAMSARIRQTDAVAGVSKDGAGYRVLLEGNEDEAFVGGVRLIVGLALGAGDELMPYQVETVEARGGMAYTVSMIAMLLMTLFVGGATIGMSIVDERESGAIRAVAVSPTRLGGYVATKLAPALILGLVGIVAAALIIGKASLLPNYLLLGVASVFVSGMMTFAVGGFATNQVAAVGVLKLLIPVSMILPVSAIFVPEQWQFFYYALPMYWQYRALEAILSGAPALWFTLLTLLVSLPWFAAAVRMFSKKAVFRKRR